MPASLRRLWIQMTADRRRFGILVGVALVGVLLWARIIVISKPPKKAIANPEASAASVLERERQMTAQADSDKDPIETIEIVLAEEPGRDPFRVSPKHFPKPTLPADSDEDATKSLNHSAEDFLRMQAQRAARLRELAGSFTLEAVMKGARLAVIDGRTYQVGDSIAARSEPGTDFTLVAVNERSVTIECEDHRFEIEMPVGIERNRP